MNAHALAARDRCRAPCHADPGSPAADRRASAAAAAAGLPSSRRTFEHVMRDGGGVRRRARRARGRRRRQSAGCRAARRTRTSRCRAGPCRSCRAAARAPWFEITCAVPVLPDTSLPAIRALPPVPAPFTTIHRPSRIACSFSGSMSTFDCGGGAGTGFQPLPSSTAFSRCGVTRVPPLASVAM